MWPTQVAQVGDRLDYSLLGQGARVPGCLACLASTTLLGLTSAKLGASRAKCKCFLSSLEEESSLLAALATYGIVTWEGDC